MFDSRQTVMIGPRAAGKSPEVGLRIRLILLIGLLMCVAMPTSARSQPPAPPPVSPDAIRGLLYARPFLLTEPYSYDWSRDGLVVSSGYILVLDVDPEFARPRQTDMAVLFVGARPAEIANGLNQDGRVVALVPGPVDLEGTPIFYGSTVLPERVDGIRGAAELAQALAQGIGPQSQEDLTAALSAGGDTLAVRSIDDIYRALADLLEIYSPGEADRISSLRLIP